MRPFRADSAWLDGWMRGALLLLLALVVGACAGRNLREGADGRLTHRDLGYSIEAPRFADDAAWTRISLDGTDLAYRRPDGRSMSLSSSCKHTRSKPALLARRLLIGVPSEDVLSAHPIAHRGDPGWAQIVETETGAAAIQIKTVTVVSGGCVFDWVLVANAGPRFEDSLPIFDAWWASFERHAEEAPPPESTPRSDPEQQAPA